ncbi:MAG: hypothetical protein IT480_03765, partial [Gammaproteobacteria bacterium]|nr:hypothetical protein [Gammaproteobacteria bacterium]
MCRSLAVLLVAVVAIPGAGAGAAAEQGERIENGSAGAPTLATPFPAPDTVPDPLPEAGIAEPFAIGEALYDPDRVADAVMSLLERMGIDVLPDAAAPAPGRLVLDESEARTLIALTEDDLEGSGGLEDLPFGFEDLHRAVAGLLPQMSVEELAEAYTRAYAAQPDSLVAQVLMGQPLEPQTRLTRTQIWLLLMDGFARPDGARATYGVADAGLPDLPSPNPAWSPAEWREVLARLPLVAASRLVAVRQTANGATLQRVVQPPVLRSRITGKPLLAARAGSLAGQRVTWEVAEASPLRELGSLSTPTGQPVPIAANGTATFTLQPSGASSGPGELVQ